MHEEVPNH